MKDDHRQLLPSWLVSLFGRAVHPYRRGQGFESRTSLNFFSGFLFASAKVAYITAMIIVHLILHSAVHIYDFHIFKTLKTYFYPLLWRNPFSFSKFVKVHPLIEVLTIKRTSPPCKEEVINCYVTSDTASYYAFKCYLSKTWYYSVISLEGSL